MAGIINLLDTVRNLEEFKKKISEIDTKLSNESGDPSNEITIANSWLDLFKASGGDREYGSYFANEGLPKICRTLLKRKYSANPAHHEAVNMFLKTVAHFVGDRISPDAEGLINLAPDLLEPSQPFFQKYGFPKPPSSEQVAATPAISAEVQEFLNNLAPADVVEINESGKVSYYEVLSLDEFRLTAHVKNIESSESKWVSLDMGNVFPFGYSSDKPVQQEVQKSTLPIVNDENINPAVSMESQSIHGNSIPVHDALGVDTLSGAATASEEDAFKEALWREGLSLGAVLDAKDKAQVWYQACVLDVKVVEEAVASVPAPVLQSQSHALADESLGPALGLSASTAAIGVDMIDVSVASLGEESAAAEVEDGNARDLHDHGAMVVMDGAEISLTDISIGGLAHDTSGIYSDGTSMLPAMSVDADPHCQALPLSTAEERDLGEGGDVQDMSFNQSVLSDISMSMYVAADDGEADTSLSSVQQPTASHCPVVIDLTASPIDTSDQPDVVLIRKTLLRVSYLGSPEKNDEWLELTSDRLAPLNSKSFGRRGDNPVREEVLFLSATKAPTVSSRDGLSLEAYGGEPYTIPRDYFFSSPYYIDIVNTFGDAGGFEKIFALLGQKAQAADAISTALCLDLIIAVGKPKQVFSSTFIARNSMHFQEIVKTILENITTLELRNIPVEKLEAALGAMESISVAYFGRGREGTEASELLWLNIALRSLVSPYLNKRLGGLKIVADLMRRAQAGAEHPTGLKITRTVSSTNEESISYKVVPILQSLSLVKICEALNDSKALEDVFLGENAHFSLMARASEVIKAMARTNNLTDELMSAIWQAGHVQRDSNALVLLADVVSEMPLSVLSDKLFPLIADVEPRLVTTELVDVVYGVARRVKDILLVAHADSEPATTIASATPGDGHRDQAFQLHSASLLLLWDWGQDGSGTTDVVANAGLVKIDSILVPGVSITFARATAGFPWKTHWQRASELVEKALHAMASNRSFSPSIRVIQSCLSGWPLREESDSTTHTVTHADQDFKFRNQVAQYLEETYGVVHIVTNAVAALHAGFAAQSAEMRAEAFSHRTGDAADPFVLSCDMQTVLNEYMVDSARLGYKDVLKAMLDFLYLFVRNSEDITIPKEAVSMIWNSVILDAATEAETTTIVYFMGRLVLRVSDYASGTVGKPVVTFNMTSQGTTSISSTPAPLEPSPPTPLQPTSIPLESDASAATKSDASAATKSDASAATRSNRKAACDADTIAWIFQTLLNDEHFIRLPFFTSAALECVEKYFRWVNADAGLISEVKKSTSDSFKIIGDPGALIGVEVFNRVIFSALSDAVADKAAKTLMSLPQHLSEDLIRRGELVSLRRMLLDPCLQKIESIRTEGGSLTRLLMMFNGLLEESSGDASGRLRSHGRSYRGAMTVVTLNGSSKPLKEFSGKMEVGLNDTVTDFFRAVSTRIGKDAASLRFFYRGKQLGITVEETRKTFAQLKFASGETIMVSEKPAGAATTATAATPVATSAATTATNTSTTAATASTSSSSSTVGTGDSSSSAELSAEQQNRSPRTIAAMESVPFDTLPAVVLSTSKQHFNLLFDLLDTSTESSVCDEIWDLINSLPTSPALLSKWCRLDFDSVLSLLVSEHISLDSISLSKLTYMLQIIEILIQPSASAQEFEKEIRENSGGGLFAPELVSNVIDWPNRFVRLGGFEIVSLGFRRISALMQDFVSFGAEVAVGGASSSSSAPAGTSPQMLLKALSLGTQLLSSFAVRAVHFSRPGLLLPLLSAVKGSSLAKGLPSDSISRAPAASADEAKSLEATHLLTEWGWRLSDEETLSLLSQDINPYNVQASVLPMFPLIRQFGNISIFCQLDANGSLTSASSAGQEALMNILNSSLVLWSSSVLTDPAVLAHFPSADADQVTSSPTISAAGHEDAWVRGFVVGGDDARTSLSISHSLLEISEDAKKKKRDLNEKLGNWGADALLSLLKVLTAPGEDSPYAAAADEFKCVLLSSLMRLRPSVLSPGAAGTSMAAASSVADTAASSSSSSRDLKITLEPLFRLLSTILGGSALEDDLVVEDQLLKDLTAVEAEWKEEHEREKPSFPSAVRAPELHVPSTTAIGSGPVTDPKSVVGLESKDSAPVTVVTGSPAPIILPDPAFLTEDHRLHVTRTILQELHDAYDVIWMNYTVGSPAEQIPKVQFIGGTMRLLAVLVNGHDSLLSALYEDGEVQFLLRGCLGLVSLAEAAEHVKNNIEVVMGVPSLCNDSDSRSSTYALLRSFCNMSPVITIEIVRAVSAAHREVAVPTSFAFKPERESRSETGFSGIRNMGCTCYMNSLLQVLYMIPAVRNGILECPVIAHTSDEDAKNDYLLQLQRLFMSLRLSEKKAVSPDDWVYAFKDETGVKPINVRVQQDAQEFLQSLCDRLENSLSIVDDAIAHAELVSTTPPTAPSTPDSDSPSDIAGEKAVLTLGGLVLDGIGGNLGAFMSVDGGGSGAGEGSSGPAYALAKPDCLQQGYPVATTAAGGGGGGGGGGGSNRAPFKDLMKNIFGGKLCQLMFKEGGAEDSHREESSHADASSPSSSSSSSSSSGVRQHEAPYVCLSVDVKGSSGLEDSLRKFVQPETISDFKWEDDGPRVNITTRQCLAEMSDTLIFHLKRFELNFDTFIREKVNDRFPFPKFLNMKIYTREHILSSRGGGSSSSSIGDSEARSDDYYMYELGGVVVHTGTTDSGHYFSYIKEPVEGHSSAQRRWFEFNDSDIRSFSESQLDSECFGGHTMVHEFYPKSDVTSTYSTENQKNAYMLVYHRVHPLNSSSKSHPASASVPGVGIGHWSPDPASYSAFNKLVTPPSPLSHSFVPSLVLHTHSSQDSSTGMEGIASADVSVTNMGQVDRPKASYSMSKYGLTALKHIKSDNDSHALTLRVFAQSHLLFTVSLLKSLEVHLHSSATDDSEDPSPLMLPSSVMYDLVMYFTRALTRSARLDVVKIFSARLVRLLQSARITGSTVAEPPAIFGSQAPYAQAVAVALPTAVHVAQASSSSVLRVHDQSAFHTTKRTHVDLTDLPGNQFSGSDFTEPSAKKLSGGGNKNLSAITEDDDDDADLAAALAMSMETVESLTHVEDSSLPQPRATSSNLTSEDVAHVGAAHGIVSSAAHFSVSTLDDGTAVDALALHAFTIDFDNTVLPLLTAPDADVRMVTARLLLQLIKTALAREGDSAFFSDLPSIKEGVMSSILYGNPYANFSSSGAVAAGINKLPQAVAQPIINHNLIQNYNNYNGSVNETKEALTATAVPTAAPKKKIDDMTEEEQLAYVLSMSAEECGNGGRGSSSPDSFTAAAAYIGESMAGFQPLSRSSSMDNIPDLVSVTDDINLNFPGDSAIPVQQEVSYVDLAFQFILQLTMTWRLAQLGDTWRRGDAYTWLLLQVSKISPATRWLLVKRETVCDLVDLFLGDQCPLNEQLYSKGSRKRPPSSYQSVGPPSKSGALNSASKNIPDWSYLIETVTILVTSAKNKGFLNAQSRRPTSTQPLAPRGWPELDKHSQDCTLNRIFLATVMKQARYAELIGPLIIHQCSYFIDYSNVVAEVLMESLSMTSIECAAHIYATIEIFFSIQDGFAAFRANNFINNQGGLMDFLKGLRDTKGKGRDLCIHLFSFFTLCQRSPAVRNLLSAPPSVLQNWAPWMLKTCFQFASKCEKEFSQTSSVRSVHSSEPTVQSVESATATALASPMYGPLLPPPESMHPASSVDDSSPTAPPTSPATAAAAQSSGTIAAHSAVAAAAAAVGAAAVASTAAVGGGVGGPVNTAVVGPYYVVYGESPSERESTWLQRAQRTMELLQSVLVTMGGDVNRLMPDDALELTAEQEAEVATAASAAALGVPMHSQEGNMDAATGADYPMVAGDHMSDEEYARMLQNQEGPYGID